MSHHRERPQQTLRHVRLAACACNRTARQQQHTTTRGSAAFCGGSAATRSGATFCWSSAATRGDAATRGNTHGELSGVPGRAGVDTSYERCGHRPHGRRLCQPSRQVYLHIGHARPPDAKRLGMAHHRPRLAQRHKGERCGVSTERAYGVQDG